MAAFNKIKPNMDPAYQGIKGSTTINHRIRVKLGLAAKYYCVMDLLDQWSKPNDELIVIWNFHEHIGIDEDQAKEYIAHLVEAEYLEQISDRKFKILDKWRKEFPRKDDLFEQIWKLYPKGSKAKALSRYKTVIRTVDPQHLYNRRKAYVDYHKSKGTAFEYHMGLDVFFNPEAANWDNPLPTDKGATQDSAGINLVFTE